MKGFIRLPREFLQEPLWVNLKPDFQHIFLVILEKTAFKSHKFDDHGFMIDLKPGQLCITFRELHSHCHKSIHLSKISRAIEKFTIYGFIKSEILNTKTVLTITDKRLSCCFEDYRHIKFNDSISYQDQLKTDEWKEFAEEVKEKSEWKCEICQCVDKPLQAHHKKYIHGRKAWQYHIDTMQCLCNECHKNKHSNVV